MWHAVWAMNAHLEPPVDNPDPELGGGWWQHNAKRKAAGLPEEALDNDNPNHIQIVTDYAQKHATKWAPLACCHCLSLALHPPV